MGLLYPFIGLLFGLLIAAAAMAASSVMVVTNPNRLRGWPVRLNFRREETAACSEMVVLAEFGKSARLPEGEVVTVEFLPEQPGEYEFACQMGMLRGKLIVE